MSSRSAWSSEGVSGQPELHSETLIQGERERKMLVRKITVVIQLNERHKLTL